MLAAIGAIPIIGPWIVSTLGSLAVRAALGVGVVAAAVVAVLLYLQSVRDEAARSAITRLTMQIEQVRAEERERWSRVNRETTAEFEKKSDELRRQAAELRQQIEDARDEEYEAEKRAAAAGRAADRCFSADRVRKLPR